MGLTTAQEPLRAHGGADLALHDVAVRQRGRERIEGMVVPSGMMGVE